jgi:FkbM family methyltransferase
MTNISVMDKLKIFADLHFLNYVRAYVDLRKFVVNWWDVLLVRLGLKKGAIIEIRQQNKKAYISSTKDYFRLVADIKTGERNQIFESLLTPKIGNDTIELIFRGKRLYFYFDDKNQLVNTMRLINEVYLAEVYKWLKVENKDVVDIGANIGDTSIYFALRGARRVYAFEPYPYSYRIAKRNVEMNRMQDRIYLFNEGCGGDVRLIKIDENYHSTRSSYLKEFPQGKEVKVIPLKTIVERFSIAGGVLKLDCEGAEYPIVLRADTKTLSAFDQIIIEYHHGYIDLKRKLKENGFTVRVTRPRKVCSSLAKIKPVYLGYLYAWK